MAGETVDVDLRNIVDGEYGAIIESTAEETEVISEEIDINDEEPEVELPVLHMPRLEITDKNLPYTQLGEMVVADEEGGLYAVRVDEDGALEERALTIGTENLPDGSIPASKLEEGSITARELDMGSLFEDSELMRQMLEENLDIESLREQPPMYEKATIQINTSDWVNKACEKTINTVNAEQTIVVSPHPDSYIVYCNARIRCVGQADEKLTFQCETVPVAAVTVNVLMM